MISAEEFLAVLEQKDLLPAKILESLRGQVAKSAGPIAASAVAKLLIQKGLLTPALAQRLLSAGPKSSGRVEDRPKPKSPARPKKPADDEELELLPLDDPMGRVPLDEPGGLVPLGEPAGLVPLEDLGSLEELTLAEETPASPAVRKPPAAAPKPSSPGIGIPASAKRPQAKPAQAPATKAAQPAAEKPSTAAPAAAGGSLLDEELPELSSGVEIGPLDGLMNADAATLAGPLAAPEKKKGRSEKRSGRRRAGIPR